MSHSILLSRSSSSIPSLSLCFCFLDSCYVDDSFRFAAPEAASLSVAVEFLAPNAIGTVRILQIAHSANTEYVVPETAFP